MIIGTKLLVKQHDGSWLLGLVIAVPAPKVLSAHTTRNGVPKWIEYPGDSFLVQVFSPFDPKHNENLVLCDSECDGWRAAPC